MNNFKFKATEMENNYIPMKNSKHSKKEYDREDIIHRRKANKPRRINKRG